MTAPPGLLEGKQMTMMTKPTITTLAALVATANELRLEGVLTRREWAQNLRIIFDRAERLGFSENDVMAETARLVQVGAKTEGK